MNSKKWIPAITLILLVSAMFKLSSCDPSKKSGGGTGGSVRDTASVTPVKKP